MVLFVGFYRCPWESCVWFLVCWEFFIINEWSHDFSFSTCLYDELYLIFSCWPHLSISSSRGQALNHYPPLPCLQSWHFWEKLPLVRIHFALCLWGILVSGFLFLQYLCVISIQDKAGLKKWVEKWFYAVVDWIIAAQDVHTLIPEICEWIPYMAKTLQMWLS